MLYAPARFFYDDIDCGVLYLDSCVGVSVYAPHRESNLRLQTGMLTSLLTVNYRGFDGVCKSL